MRILGIDAGLHTTGVAILDTDISDFILIEKINTTIKKATPTTASRTRWIAGEISQLIMEHGVDVAVIEDIFVPMNKSQTSAIIPVARLRGAIEQIVTEWLDVLYVYPTMIMKQVVGGKGNCTKVDCYNAIKARYPHSKLLQEKLGEAFIEKNKDKNDDISDACCIAHTYAVASERATLA